MKHLTILSIALLCFAAASFSKQDTAKVNFQRQDSTLIHSGTNTKDSVIDLGKMPKMKKRGLINNIDTPVSRGR
jgi:hypothetical protein